MLTGVLISQNVSLVLTLHYTRAHYSGRKTYLAETVILASEILKFVGWLLWGLRQVPVESALRTLSDQFKKPEQQCDSLRILVPALLYVVQSNLLYFAIGRLDPVTYQLTGQLKILTTAFFTVIILRRRFTSSKWISLLLLTTGVTMVQLRQMSPHAEAHSNHIDVWGQLAVLAAAITSGFAGVYFEKIIKEPAGRVNVTDKNDAHDAVAVIDSPTLSGLVLNNLRLACFSAFFAASGMALAYGRGVFIHFFEGWDALVWFIVINSALGGIIVAITIKYLDNVVKGFAMSCSIVLAGFFQALLGLDTKENDAAGVLWWIGSSLILVSVVLYQRS